MSLFERLIEDHGIEPFLLDTQYTFLLKSCNFVLARLASFLLSFRYSGSCLTTLIIIKHSRDSIVFGTGLARIKVFPKRIRNDLNSEVQVKIEVCGREKDNEAYDRLYSLF